METSSVTRSTWEGRRTALVIAHPGHELLVHGWLEQAKPVVCVLSTGSDNGNAAVTTTAKIIERAGARIGSLFGRFTDRGLLQALLMREKSRFHSLAQELADMFLTESIDIVAGDAAEGHDPAHDLCRVLVDAATGIAAQLKPTIRNFEFSLMGTRQARATGLRQRIEGDAWLRKLDSCRAYAEPIEEVERLTATDGDEALRDECLRLATPWAINNRQNVLYAAGKERIAAVHFQEHMLPVAGAMQRYVSGRHSSAA
jgi:AcrR family transcriptional regulator